MSSNKPTGKDGSPAEQPLARPAEQPASSWRRHRRGIVVNTHPRAQEHTDLTSGTAPWAEDIADIFDEEWVIWNGCFSRSLCELADNLLPTQCKDGVIRASDDTWREIMRCLENTGGRPHSRDEICEIVFGEDWESDNEGDRPRR